MSVISKKMDFRIILSSFILFVFVQFSFADLTITQNPQISSIYPTAGGLLGGNRMYIYGQNFAQNGLNSDYHVFVGNDLCKIIPYYSSDQMIVCIVPACSDEQCLSTDDFRGSVTVQVGVYVQTVETILEATSTYTYSYSLTPYVTRMLHTVWGTATSFISTLFDNSNPVDTMAIRFNGQLSDLGDPNDDQTGIPNDLFNNPAKNYYPYAVHYIFYRPPADCPAAFLNMTVTVENLKSPKASASMGLANFYPIAMPLDKRTDYSYSYLFRSSLAGVSYSTLLLPVVASVSPSVGSVAGGTVVTINGHGFSYNPSDMTVFVGGESCSVLTSSPHKITCVTGEVSAVAVSRLLDLSVIKAVEAGQNLKLRSARPYGSAGAWVRIWDGFVSPEKSSIWGSLPPVKGPRLSIPWRDGLFFSYYTQWGQFYGQDYHGWSAYTTDIRTTFIAPYTGAYVFYFNVDDRGVVYNATGGVIASANAWQTPLDFYLYPSQISVPIRMTCGERFPLRIFAQNGGYTDHTNYGDQIILGVRISPDFTITESGAKVLSDSLDPTLPSRLQYPSVVPPAHLPINLLQHHAVRDIQTINLAMHWLPEVQTITFNHVNPGDTFQVILQSYFPSPAIPFSNAGPGSWGIKGLLSQATYSMPTDQIECASFGTSLNKLSATSYQLVVSYMKCSSKPLFTLMKALPSNSSITWSVARTQEHSLAFSGNLGLSVLGHSVSVPYTTSAQGMQSILQAASSVIRVDVDSSSSEQGLPDSIYSTNLIITTISWKVTFITPRGDLPIIVGDISSLVGGYSVEVVKAQNGTEEELWFESIPSFMTEIPLEWAAENVSSVVEVYTNTPSGDVIKAACDGSGYAGPGLEGYAKGSEADCAFSYATDKTPLIMLMNVTRYAANDTAIVYFEGKGFTAGNISQVKVMVANVTCAISQISDSSIYCTVADVPAGVYKPTVYVPNLGYALYSNLTEHLIITQQVFSYTQMGNSVSGGGNITITGRGFSYHSQVTIAYTNSHNQKVQMPCWNLTATPSAIKCTVPPLPADAVSVLFPQANNHYFNIINASEHFEVLIDGAHGSPRNYITYSFESTPYISSVYPTEISFASSAILNFTGSKLLGVSSVYVGTSVCAIKFNTDTSLSCFLPRSKNVTQNYLQNVYIVVSGKGYVATSINVPYQVPQVKRGFHVTNLSTHFGSLYGGNNLTISGVGFLETNVSRYTVTLVQENTPSYIDSYNQILIKLGQSPVGSEFINCAIYNLSRDSITCNIATSKTTSNVNYLVTVSLNNVQSLCADPSTNETDCVYSETLDHSPQVFNMSQLSLSPSNVASFRLHGYLFDSSAADNLVTIGSTICSVVSATTTILSVVSPPLSVPLTGSDYPVSVLVGSRGFAISNVTMSVPLNVYSVTVSSQNVSFGGGSVISIAGAGFENFPTGQSSMCAEANIVSLQLYGIVAPISVTTILSCSSTMLVVSLPNITLVASPSVPTYTVLSVNVLVGQSSMSISNSKFHLQYTRAASPLFYASVTNTIGYAYQTISFNVSIPTPSTKLKTNVTVGGLPCLSLTSVMHTVTQSTYSCKVPVLSAGFHSVVANVWPFGNAITPQYLLPQFESLLQVHPYSAPSYFKLTSNGGATINITGRGFSDDTAVTVCGVPCFALTPKYEYIECQLPTNLFVRDVNSIAKLKIEQESLIQSITVGSYFSNNKGLAGVLASIHDGLYSTVYADTWSGCYVGLAAPQGYLFQPSRLRVYPQLTTSISIQKFFFEGSMDNGQSYVTLATSTLAIHEGWNYVDTIQNYTSQWFTHLRYRPIAANTGLYCAIAELDFIGTVAWNNTHCPIQVTTANPPQTASPGNLSFTPIKQSPIIYLITPGNGTALGGTNITLSGVNLLPTSTYTSMADLCSRVYVTLSGVVCSVYHVTATTIHCTTGVRPPEDVTTSVVTALIGGRGWALIDDRAQYLYIDKWSALTSWLNQEQPLDGDLVYIPDGQVILLDESTPILTALIIEGALYFDPTKDLALDASYIFVNGGLLQVGTHEHPYEKQANITLHGDRYKTIEIPFIGSKVLAVASKGVPMTSTSTGIQIPSRYVGQLEIHGKVRKRTWTHLQKTAVAGTNIIVTAEPVDFAPGEVLVIPGSSLESSTKALPQWSYEEVTVLRNIDNYHIELVEPLVHNHTSEIVHVNGLTIDMRCEVALLTRNVVIQGDENSYGQLFGVHTVAMRSGIYRIENAELRHCGQSFAFGRYCTHSHLAGNMEGSYVKANSIHHSFQRAVTTHGTSYWEVRDNVAFNVMGHPFFVEGGSETYNTFSGNLAILTLPSTALLGSDTAPSSYWTATALNFWYDNKGVHATHGFWLQLATMADLGAFRNNTFHHQAQMGFRIYPTYTPDTPQTMYDLLSYRNGGQGLFSKTIGDLHHHGHILVENGGDEISIVRYSGVPYYKNIPALVNITCIGTLGHVNESVGLGKFALNAPQWEHFHVSGLTVINYGGGGAITTCNECLVGAMMNQGANTYRFDSMKFINTSKRILWTETQKDIMWDLDGSLAGVADTMLTKYYPYNNWPECQRLPAHIYDDTSRCKTIRRVAVDSFTPGNLAYKTLLFMSAVGNYSMFFLPLDVFGWVVSLAANHHYQLVWTTQSAQSFAVTYGRPEYLTERIHQKRPENITIVFSPYRYDYVPYTFELSYNGKTKFATINGTHPIRNISDGYYRNNTLEFGISTAGAVADGSTQFAVGVNSLICPLSGCYIPPPIVPHLHNKLWSSNATWGKVGKPKAGLDVVISANMSVVLDINTPALGVVYVYGKLSFLQGVSATLTCKSILVYGILEIAGANNTAFNGTANIVITGTTQNSIAPSIGNGIYQGSKVIAVMGQFTAIGQPTATVWTQLKSTAQQGNSTIVLSTVVDWSVGSEIVLSPTGFYDSTGVAYVDKGNTVLDILKIAKLVTKTDPKTHANYTIITTTTPLNQTHLCHSENGQLFCGYAGLLTRNIHISSRDSETPSSSSYGFGAHIFVTDLATFGSGALTLEYVTLQNLGKLDTDWMAITFDYQQSGKQQRSIVKGCAFKNSYNYMMYSTGAQNLTITDNVATKAVGGGIYIGSTCSNVVIARNLIMYTTQLPSYLSSKFLWNRPFGSFMILSPSVLVHDNVAALSGDTGFYLVQSLFTKNAPSTVCANTRGNPFTVTPNILTKGASVWNNEAVGCQIGMFLVSLSLGEVSTSDCAVVSGFKVWRNAHAGFMSTDTVANVLIANSIVAENHIGVSLNFYKFSDDAFSGVYNTVFTAFLKSHGSDTCGLSDTNWAQVCRAASPEDPLGNHASCSSVLAGSTWQSVGVMLPQFLNSPRTCGVSGNLRQCDPPTTVTRLCSLPYNGRYGTVAGYVYAEQIIADVTFVGYSLSNCTKHRSSAVSFNPEQVDYQPALMMSQIKWQNTDANAKFGFNTGLQGHQLEGQDLALIHDFDGSASGVGLPGQIIFDNPEFIAPPPACSSLSVLGLGFYFCETRPVDHLSSVTAAPFQVYSAMWLDYGPQVIQPLIVTHDFPGQNRSAAYFGPTFEDCSESGYFSRFPFALAVNTTNYILTTGTIPADGWNIRWDAPSSATAIVQFFVQNSDVINVFVGTSSGDPNPIQANQLLDGSFPSLRSPAGTHTRDPQRRSLTVTFRGGKYRFYSFVDVPVIQVTIRLQMSVTDFFSKTFIANLATLLGLSARQIKIANVRAASVSDSANLLTNVAFLSDPSQESIPPLAPSVTISQSTIVDFTISDNTTTTPNYDHTLSQIHSLQQVASVLNNSAYSGLLQTILQIPILNIGIVPPYPAYRIDINNVTYTNQTAYQQRIEAILKEQKKLQQSGSTNLAFYSSHPTAAPITSASPVDVLSPGSIAGICIAGGLIVGLVLYCMCISYLRRKVVKRKSQAVAAESSLNYDSEIYSDAARNAESLTSTGKVRTESITSDGIKRPSVLSLIKVDNPLSSPPRTSDAAIAALEATSPREIPTSPTFGSKMAVAFEFATQTLLNTFSQRNIRVSPQSPATPSQPADTAINPILETVARQSANTEVPIPVIPDRKSSNTSEAPVITTTNSDVEESADSTIPAVAEDAITNRVVSVKLDTPVDAAPEPLVAPVDDSSPSSVPTNDSANATTNTKALAAKFNLKDAPIPTPAAPPRRRTEPAVFVPPSIPDFTANPNINKTVGGLAAPSMTALVRKKDDTMKELIEKGRRKSLADM